MHYFYIFKCTDGTLYSGSTNNLLKREQLHNSGKGAKYTRSRGGGTIVYFENFRIRSKALKRESEIKKWPRAKKLLLLQKKSANFKK